MDIPNEDGKRINFILGPAKGVEALTRQMILLSQGMADCSASRGGVLLHGALASWKSKGVLLCGASGSGKTTASNRLPSPWRSLSDDATLLVRDRQGRYWAHPWPTWSRYLSKKENPIQPLAGPVRLQAICFLKKSVKDRISNASPKGSIVRLMAASEQAVNLMAEIMPVAQRNRQRIDRLDLCCDLARRIPIFHLSVSLTGKFWELVERTLAETS
ncbi:MAG: SynChlorMet cassette protein ScmC [Desulfobacterales bacterium]